VTEESAETATEDETSTIEMLERLARDGAADHERNSIIEIAEATASPRIRNAAALAMADLRVQGAEQALIRLLGRGETKNSRGTLLYALEEMGAEVPLSLMVRILIEENYEGREQALDLLGKGQVAFTTAEFDAAAASLVALAESDDDYGATVGRTALNWLSELARGQIPSFAARAAHGLDCVGPALARAAVASDDRPGTGCGALAEPE
jgi:hypothetical protein